MLRMILGLSIAAYAGAELGSLTTSKQPLPLPLNFDHDLRLRTPHDAAATVTFERVFQKHQTGKGGQLAAGMKLVTEEEARQWEMRVIELEEECSSLKERASAAETMADLLRSDLETEKQQGEEIMAQVKFVESLVNRVKTVEVHMSHLEQTKEKLIDNST